MKTKCEEEGARLTGKYHVNGDEVKGSTLDDMDTSVNINVTGRYEKTVMVKVVEKFKFVIGTRIGKSGGRRKYKISTGQMIWMKEVKEEYNRVTTTTLLRQHLPEWNASNPKGKAIKMPPQGNLILLADDGGISMAGQLINNNQEYEDGGEEASKMKIFGETSDLDSSTDSNAGVVVIDLD